MNYPHARNGFLALCLIGTAWLGCNTPKQVRELRAPENTVSGNKPDVSEKEEPPYQPAAKRVNDIQHMRLEISFDWEHACMPGKVTLQINPFLPQVNMLQLSAIDMEIREVAMLSGNLKTKLKYIYDNRQLHIDLGRNYKQSETYSIYIDYIAHPQVIQGRTNEAEPNKGMYYVLSGKEFPGGLPQVWTEGETQFNSRWFPTIDAPNERFTQEIAITVQPELTTLSNGLLVWQQKNADSTRTDVWKQNIPSPPYLSMVAVGNFTITKDRWKDKEVSYYTDPTYAPYAREIFGKTPEMIDFFSKKTGVDFPWEKYSQVVVQGHLIGAMENTSASLFGDFMQQTSRELRDENNEEYIAHELMHQWFGDYVTCKSWANLTLNEGFATYGEYLWYEYKYGRTKADEHLRKFLNDYLDESAQKKEPLIRYHYADADELFDAHTYQKGALVLHMLRGYLGDDLFFSGLKNYLEKNKLSSVDISDFRRAMEETSGEDLNWFFEQWFMKKDIPEVSITYNYNDTLKKVSLQINQFNSGSSGPFALPVKVDLYTKGKKEVFLFMAKKERETFEIASAQRPDLVDVDPEKILLINRTEEKSLGEWVYQFNKSPWFNSRLMALNSLSGWMDEPAVTETFLRAFSDPTPSIRLFCISQVPGLARYADSRVRQQLTRLATRDEVNLVREKATESLGTNYNTDDLLGTYQKMLDDPSPMVCSKALLNLFDLDKKLGLEFARTFRDDSSRHVVKAVGTVLSHMGDDIDNAYFTKHMRSFSGREKFDFAHLYATFLLHRHDSIINRAIPMFEGIALEQNMWYIRLAGTNALNQLMEMYTNRQKETRDRIAMLKNANSSPAQLNQLESIAAQTNDQINKIAGILHSIKTQEKDENLRQIYKQN